MPTNIPDNYTRFSSLIREMWILVKKCFLRGLNAYWRRPWERCCSAASLEKAWTAGRPRMGMRSSQAALSIIPRTIPPLVSFSDYISRYLFPGRALPLPLCLAPFSIERPLLSLLFRVSFERYLPSFGHVLADPSSDTVPTRGNPNSLLDTTLYGVGTLATRSGVND